MAARKTTLKSKIIASKGVRSALETCREISGSNLWKIFGFSWTQFLFKVRIDAYISNIFGYIKKNRNYHRNFQFLYVIFIMKFRTQKAGIINPRWKNISSLAYIHKKFNWTLKKLVLNSVHVLSLHNLKWKSRLHMRVTCSLGALHAPQALSMLFKFS